MAYVVGAEKRCGPEPLGLVTGGLFRPSLTEKPAQAYFDIPEPIRKCCPRLVTSCIPTCPYPFRTSSSDRAITGCNNPPVTLFPLPLPPVLPHVPGLRGAVRVSGRGPAVARIRLRVLRAHQAEEGAGDGRRQVRLLQGRNSVGRSSRQTWILSSDKNNNKD